MRDPSLESNTFQKSDKDGVNLTKNKACLGPGPGSSHAKQNVIVVNKAATTIKPGNKQTTLIPPLAGKEADPPGKKRRLQSSRVRKPATKAPSDF